MTQLALVFVRDERAHDLIEYTLLAAFVCLASAAVFPGMQTDMGRVWKNASQIVSNAGHNLT